MSTKCDSWPEAFGWDCQNGGGWTELDGSIGFSDTAGCELLCRRQNSKGCCYLDRTKGCFWKNSADVTRTSGYKGIAVACVTSGIHFLNLRIYYFFVLFLC